MWVVTISPSTKKKENQFKPFTSKYPTKSSALNAIKQLIRISNSAILAPCDEETGKEETVFSHAPWSISGPDFVNE